MLFHLVLEKQAAGDQEDAQRDRRAGEKRTVVQDRVFCDRFRGGTVDHHQRNDAQGDQNECHTQQQGDDRFAEVDAGMNILPLGVAPRPAGGGGDAAVLKAMSDAGKKCGVELVSIVMNFATEEAVAPIRPNCLNAFLEQIDRYSDNALAAGCRQGIVTTGQSVTGCNRETQSKALLEAMRQAGQKVASKGFQLNLEVLNTYVDHPGYFLDDPADGIAIVKDVNLQNVKLLYDVYHMEIMRGNQTVFIENHIDWIGHFHSAGVPGRHELFLGETNYPFVLQHIQNAGYKGFFGLEYFPTLESGESLRKTMEYLS